MRKTTEATTAKEAIEGALYRNERVLLLRYRKPALAVIPLEDLRWLERIEAVAARFVAEARAAEEKITAEEAAEEALAIACAKLVAKAET